MSQTETIGQTSERQAAPALETHPVVKDASHSFRTLFLSALQKPFKRREPPQTPEGHVEAEEAWEGLERLWSSSSDPPTEKRPRVVPRKSIRKSKARDKPPEARW